MSDTQAGEAADAASIAAEKGHGLLEVVPLVAVSVAYSLIAIAEALTRLAEKWGSSPPDR